jgi:DNA segregation ATPase FtsK/SpoIIIE, S-DNA-T family
MVVGKSLQGVFSQLGATLLLLALFFTGVTLLTGLSWLKLMDTLGFHTLRFMPVLEKYVLHQFTPWLLNRLKRLGLMIRRALLFWFMFECRSGSAKMGGFSRASTKSLGI